MRFAKFYAWATIVVAIMAAAGNACVVAHGGKINSLALLLVLPALFWWFISGITIVIFVLEKLPPILPSYYVLSYLFFFAVGAVWHLLRPGPKRVMPLELCCIDWLWQLSLLVFAYHLLKSISTRLPKPTIDKS